MIHYEVGLTGERLPDYDDVPHHLARKGLPRITYEPGWTFWWDRGESLHWNIEIRPPALKAFDCVTGEPRPISWRYTVAHPDWRWCWERIRGIEFHLAGEWFQVDGEKPMHPHRQDSLYPYNTIDSHVA